MNAITTDYGTVYELTAAEGNQMLEQMAQERLGMSGAEFIRMWTAGEIEDTPAAMDVAMLLPEESWAVNGRAN